MNSQDKICWASFGLILGGLWWKLLHQLSNPAAMPAVVKHKVISSREWDVPIV